MTPQIPPRARRSRSVRPSIGPSPSTARPSVRSSPAPSQAPPPSPAPLRHDSLALALVTLALTFGCVDDTTASANAGAGQASGSRALLVVGGDYQTSVLSRVDVDSEAVVAPGFLHSGSSVGATGTAFSGDVVVGTVADGSGDALALDRGRGVLTRLHGLEVKGQFDVAPGFFGNPQDALAVAGEVWVARGQRAAAGAGTEAEGDDVIALDASGHRTGRLDLASEATIAGHLAMAGAGAWDGQRWWLPLASIRDDFQAVGPGRIVAIGRADGRDGATLVVRARADLPGLRNCRAVRRAATAAAAGAAGLLVVGCSGSFAGTPAEQLAGSGVAVVRADGAAIERVISAQDIGQRPLGFALAVAAARPVAWVVDLGDLEAGSVDRLWQLDLASGKATLIRAGAGAFSLVTLWHDDVRARLWAVDHGDLAGDLAILDSAPALAAEGAAALFVRKLPSNPGGLRALEVGPW